MYALTWHNSVDGLSQMTMELAPKVSISAGLEERLQQIQPFLDDLVQDVKHSGDWYCEFNCGGSQSAT